jgi:hypothetical protein
MKSLVVALTSVAMLSSGCSIAFLDKARVTPDNKVECDSTMKMPLIDGAVAVVGISTPFILEALRDRSKDNPNFLIYVPLWVTGVGTAISAVIGRSKVNRCRSLKESVAATSNVPAQPAAPAQDAPAPAPAQ